MKIATYIRVSTESQIDNYSIPLQRERLNAYCKVKGWEKITEYIDGGYTGSNIDRPELTKLIQNLNSIDVVLVYRLDRLSRSQKDTIYLIEEKFLPADVEFISVSEAIDTTSPFGRAMIGILSVFAQLERETITERMKSGRYKLVKEEGLWAGGKVTNPTGYIRKHRGKLELDPATSQIVTKIFKDYLFLKSITKLQHKFKKEGLPVWRFGRYSRILRNRLYIGEVSFSGEWFQGVHTPLIDKETYDSVQAIMDTHKGTNYGKIKDMYLSGIIKCGLCGESMMSYKGKYKDRKYSYYICRARRFPAEYPQKCNNKLWTKENLDEIIFREIENFHSKNFIKHNKIKKVNYNKQIKNIEKKIKKTLDLYIDGEITKGILDEKIIELTNTKKQLETQKHNYDLNIKNQISELDIIDIKNKDQGELKSIIRMLINKVTITDEDIEIIWNLS